MQSGNVWVSLYSLQGTFPELLAWHVALLDELVMITSRAVAVAVLHLGVPLLLYRNDAMLLIKPFTTALRMHAWSAGFPCACMHAC